MPNDLRLVLFDCDGTLIDSFSTIKNCMVNAFEDFNFPVPSDAAIKSIIGLSLPIAITRLAQGVDLSSNVTVPADEMTACYKQHFSRLRDDNRVYEPLYAGIGDLLKQLSSMDNIILGMVTGKSRRGVDMVMAEQGFDCFVASRCADECPSKPHPAMVLECCDETGVTPDCTLVVGDAIYDMQMAKAAGAKAIGVDWGYHKAEQLLKAGADSLLKQPLDLLKLLS
ncbi:HAD-IA family hydrolase [Bartonella sp. HY761]|uniref:HAD-IA family hydrolase n=1 Tax=Bartonella sp. HY761 TaxID=2979330 RepID=UPI0021FD699A|nr:HAD-IA family hydrolase [Bartonella sp. HY761]UXN07070.1 HAD-IA family hydrolase [Bartonella sp. HY761]